MKSIRLNALPETLRRELKATRVQRGWSQEELGRRAGLPQVHISRIETGRIVPRFDTLLDIVRILGFDLVLIPRSLVPAVQALVREQRRESEGGGEGDDEQPLYAITDDIAGYKEDARS